MLLPWAFLACTPRIITDAPPAAAGATALIPINIAAVNAIPTIGAIFNQTTLLNIPLSGIAFSVTAGGGSDEDSQALSVTATSSNTTLIPNGNITITYTDAPGTHTRNGTLTITPANGQSGTATITLSAQDNGTGNLTGTRTFDVTVNNIGAVHGGWNDVQAKGPRTPAAQATDLSSANASITIGWNAFTITGGAVDIWNVYRATSQGSEDFGAPLASGIASGTRTYTDNTVVAGTTYYYVVRPVVNTYVVPTTEADTEIKVVVPPDNMVLVHRWIANQEMCTLMGKAIDRTNNYRCEFTGMGGTGTHFDIGQSLLVDAYELGCNYTYSSTENKCGQAAGCIGLGNPNIKNADGTAGFVTGAAGDVYYDRSSGYCYINTNGAHSWTSADSVTLAAQRQAIASNKPGLPPLVYIDQVWSANTCSALTATGFGAKRILRYKEWLLAAAWPIAPRADMMSDGTIDSIEAGGAGNCNSDFGHGQSYQDLITPANLETIPGTSASGVRSVRTGGTSTVNCKSLYGAQDIVGNVWEWTSDQLSCNGTTCTGTAAASNTADNTNDDWTGAAFDNTQGPTSNNYFHTWLKIQLPIGIPIAGAYAGDGVMTWVNTQFHNDYFWIGVVAGSRGAFAGGNCGSGAQAGRFGVSVFGAPSSTDYSIGSRCGRQAGD